MKWIQDLCIVHAPPIEGEQYRWLGCYILLYAKETQPVDATIGVQELEDEDPNFVKLKYVVRQYFEMKDELERFKKSGVLIDAPDKGGESGTK